MGFILYLRNKKWLTQGFILLSMGLLLIVSVPAIIDLYKQNSPINVGKVKGNIILKGDVNKENSYEFTKRLMERLDRRFSGASVHQETWRYLVTQRIVNKLCTDHAIITEDEEVEAAINNYDKCTQEVLDEFFYERHNYIKKMKKNNPDVFRKYIESEEGQKMLPKPLLFKLVKDKIAYNKVADLFETSVLSQTIDLDFPKNEVTTSSIAVDYFEIPSSQIDILDPDEDAIQATWESKKRGSEKFKKAEYIKLSIPPTYWEVEKVINELKSLREDFEKAEDFESFIRKNSDEAFEGDNIAPWEWKPSKAPMCIKSLSKGMVSEVMQGAVGSYVLYRVIESSDQKIRACRILKRANRNDNVQHVKKRIETLKEEAERTSWEKVKEQYGYKVSTVYATKTMANKLGKETASQIAKTVFKNKIKRNQLFTIQNETNPYQIIGCVVSRGKQNRLKHVREVIKEEAIQIEKIKTLEKKLAELFKKNNQNWEATKKDLIAAFGGIAFNKTPYSITLENDKIGNNDCKEEIGNLFAKQENDFHAFAAPHKKDSIMVVRIRSKSNISKKATIKHTTQNGKERLKAYIEACIQEPHEHDIEDNRYLFY